MRIYATNYPNNYNASASPENARDIEREPNWFEVERLGGAYNKSTFTTRQEAIQAAVIECTTNPNVRCDVNEYEDDGETGRCIKVHEVMVNSSYMDDEGTLTMELSITNMKV